MAEIPNALYTNLPVVAHHGAGTTGDEWTYKIPILASDFLYNQRPDPDSGSVRTILRGREEGYPDITHFYDDICKFIGFNPFAVRDFQINNAAKNTLIEQVIHDFMGETNTRNDNWGLFYPDYGNGDSTKSVGPFLFGTGYSNAQAAYGTTPYGANPWVADVLYHWIQLRTFFTSNDGILANFEIWPEDTIKTGYIDTSKFTRSNDLIEACALQINIWYRPGATEEDAGTYNFTVQLKGYRYNQNRTTFIDNRLNDAKTGHLYNPKNPLDNKQDNGDEGGSYAHEIENTVSQSSGNGNVGRQPQCHHDVHGDKNDYGSNGISHELQSHVHPGGINHLSGHDSQLPVGDICGIDAVKEAYAVLAEGYMKNHA